MLADDGNVTASVTALTVVPLRLTVADAFKTWPQSGATYPAVGDLPVITVTPTPEHDALYSDTLNASAFVSPCVGVYVHAPDVVSQSSVPAAAPQEPVPVFTRALTPAVWTAPSDIWYT
jgi:hypothetical protein